MSSGLMSFGSGSGSMMPGSGGGGGFWGELLNAIPLAVAAPVLTWQKTKAQQAIMEQMIRAKQEERTQILLTLRELAATGQLTNEVLQQLMLAYYQPLG